METRYRDLVTRLSRANTTGGDARTIGVEQLTGHRGQGATLLDYQPAAALLSQEDREHFGYRDGISGTYFRGCGEDPTQIVGGGKPTGQDPRTMAGWEPLEAGEFILGHPDEGGAYPEAPLPPLFSRNGTFLVYRKLHQNVASFHSLLKNGRRALQRRRGSAGCEVGRAVAQRRAAVPVSDAGCGGSADA